MRVLLIGSVAVAVAMMGACSDDPTGGEPTDTQEDSADATGDAGPDVGADTTALLEPIDLSLPVPNGEARAGFSEKTADLIDGRKSEALVGDIKLANAHVAFMVEGARRSGGYRDWGGNVVDADVSPSVSGGPHQDGYGELWLTWNMQLFRPDSAEILNDGRNGEAAHVRLSGRTGAYPWPESFLGPLLQTRPAPLELVYDYVLEPDARALSLTVTSTNVTDETVDVDLPIIISSQGDGVKIYQPEDGFVQLSGRSQIPYVAAVGRDRSYGIFYDAVGVAGLFTYANIDLLTLPSYSVEPGESRTLKLWYTASLNGSSGLDVVRSEIPELAGGVEPLAALTGAVDLEAGISFSDAWVTAVDGDDDVRAIVPVSVEGTYEMALPVGSYDIQVWLPSGGGGAVEQVSLTESGAELDVAGPVTSEVTVSAVDGDGASIPAMVHVFRRAETPTPHAPGRMRFSHDWGGAISAVIFTNGVEPRTTRLPPGEYRLVATRGYSHEQDETIVTLGAGESLPLNFELEKVVDTDGWLAADLHIHAMWSSDSDVLYADRALQAAAVELALPVMTEHVYVGDITDAVIRTNVDQWVIPISAQEVTTFEYGHFNGYPYQFDRTAPSRGAVFEHGYEGSDLLTAMRNQSDNDAIVQINHPRGGISGSYFDAVGYDFVTDTASRPERWTWDWDVVEVFNASCTPGVEFDDWIAMTNNGYRKTMGGGSDSHSISKPIGHPRSWVRVDDATVRAEMTAIVDPIRARETFVSCGPFVTFVGADGTPMGGMTTVDTEGEVQFTVTVQAPSWIELAELKLRENGVVIQTIDLTTEPAPDASRPGLRFDGVLTASPTKDAWYMVEVTGSGDLAPIKFGDRPHAFTNPIEVDVDGDGNWTAPGAQ